MIIRFSIAVGLAFFVTLGIYYLIQTLISLDLKDIDRSDVIKVKPNLVKIYIEKEVREEPITIICWPHGFGPEMSFPPDIDMGKASNVVTLVNIPNPQMKLESATDQISEEMLTFKPVRLDQTEVIFPDGVDEVTEEFVVVKYTINQYGETEDVIVDQSSDRRFNKSALNAVNNFKFVPVLHDGEAVIVKDVFQRINYITRERS